MIVDTMLEAFIYSVIIILIIPWAVIFIVLGITIFFDFIGSLFD